MTTFPKRRLSSRIRMISLSLAGVVVLLFGLTVSFLEFQSGVKDAQMWHSLQLDEFTDVFTREVNRRGSRIRLLIDNPLALDAAIQSLKRSKTPEVFFGPGVLAFHIAYRSETVNGGSWNLSESTARMAPQHNILSLVLLSADTEPHSALLFEDHASIGGQPLAIRVLWSVPSLVPPKWLKRDVFHALLVANQVGQPLWKFGDWPEDIAEEASSSYREFKWKNNEWVAMSREVTIFDDPVFIRSISPKSVLYAEAWRSSRPILVRTFTLLAIAVGLVFMFALWIRQLLRPLDEITRGVRRIAQGDLESALDTSGEDEIAFLAETLNDMTNRLKVKEQSVQAHIELLKQKNDELQELSEKLKVADQLKDHFLAVLSHELRTPLTAILGYAELSLEGIYGQPTDKQKEILTYIKNNGDKLLALMEDLLDIAKIRAGTIEVNLDEFALEDLLADIRKFVANSLRQKPAVRFQEEIAAGLPTFHTDRVKLEQILSNLLSNAIKFTEHGAIRLAARLDGADRVVFEVEDTGIGIAQQHMPKIFEAFTQLDSSIRRRYGGTGLGLTICKSLVEKLGGEIQVKSELGKGSLFRIALPAKYPGMAQPRGSRDEVWEKK